MKNKIPSSKISLSEPNLLCQNNLLGGFLMCVDGRKRRCDILINDIFLQTICLHSKMSRNLNRIINRLQPIWILSIIIVSILTTRFWYFFYYYSQFQVMFQTFSFHFMTLKTEKKSLKIKHNKVCV